MESGNTQQTDMILIQHILAEHKLGKLRIMHQKQIKDKQAKCKPFDASRQKTHAL